MKPISEDDLLLLDTHCWVWLQSGETEKFSRESVEQIRHAGASGMLHLSGHFDLEIAMLEARRSQE